jgi:cytochrome c peroxidase
MISLEKPDYFPAEQPMPAGNPLTEEGVRLGRMLFYEKKLSKDGTISCASCHQQEKGFSDGLRVSPGVGSTQGTMNAMALANLHWQTRFFWNGRAVTLEEQALIPIEDPVEMNLPIQEAIKRLQDDSAYPKLFSAAFGSRVVVFFTKDGITAGIGTGSYNGGTLEIRTYNMAGVLTDSLMNNSSIEVRIYPS